VRGVLDYVPLFRGRTFVLDLMDGGLPEVAMAEVLLDVAALHGMGVKLVVVVPVGVLDGFFDEAVEKEMKVAVTTIDGAVGVLERGQVALIAGGEARPLSREVEGLALSVGATKVLIFVNGSGVLVEGDPVAAVLESAVSELLGSDSFEGGDLLQRAAEVVRAGVHGPRRCLPRGESFT